MPGQTTCPTCDYRYFESLAFSRRKHLIHHDEHRNGVRLRRLDLFERVGGIDGAQVLLVRPESARFVRHRTERVARRAIEEPPFEGDYDKPTFYAEDRYQIVPEHFAHALVLAQGSRGVGLTVLERRERCARYEWLAEQDEYRACEEPAAGPSWAVMHVWVHPSMRGQHVASRLLTMAFSGFRMTPEETAWLTPFTPGGFRLLRRFCPEFFLAAGHEPPQFDSFPRPFAS